MNPAPEQLSVFFKEWIPRYNFGITLDKVPGWVDPATGKRLHRNHIVCLMKNDMLTSFPSMDAALARKFSEKTAERIEKHMIAKIKAGHGAYVDVSDSYL